VENLVNLVDNLTAGELTSFEDMFVDILKERQTSDRLLKIVFKRFIRTESYSCAVLLRSACFGNKDYLLRRYDSYANRGLQLAYNHRIFREVLLGLERLGN